MMKDLKKRNIVSIAVFFCMTVFLFAPFEMYISNRTEMWFKISEFWWIPVLACLVSLVLICIIGCLLNGKGKEIYSAIIFALALCMYLQGNFLNLQVGVLNGSQIEWDNYAVKMWLNIIVWVGIIISCLILCLYNTDVFKKVSRLASLFLAGVQGLTLVALLVPLFFETDYNKDTYEFVSTEGLYDVGEENVVVFCLDMFDDRYFKEIYQNEPEIVKDLEGFTYFSNFTGTYSTTSYSLPHLFSGKIYYNEGSLNEWNNLRAEEGTYIDEFIDEGYELGIYSIGYSTIPEKYVKCAVNYEEAPLYITDNFRFAIDLYKLVGCKYFPDILKPYIWMDGTEFDNWKGVKSDNIPYDGTNAAFRDGILTNGITVSESDKQFKFIHINASHYPYDIDENANDVEKDSVTDVQCARGALRMVQWYLEELKKNDKYADTVVVITADHGYYWDGVLTSPVCLVKPRNSTGDMQVSNAPTSQVDLPATIIELAEVNAEADYGKSVFEYEDNENRERYFYQYYLGETNSSWKWRLIEYEIDNSGNTEEYFDLTGNEYTVNGNKIQHKEYCKTCNGEYANVEDAQRNPKRIVHVKRENYPE